MNVLELFAGAGGGILGHKILGHRTVCAVEIDEYARSVLVARQNDGTFNPFPIWDDIRTFDGLPWRGIVDVVSGGFPCQDVSVAGTGKGLDGDRSGLWSEMERVIGEVRPKYVFVENSSMLIHRGLTRVLGDITEMGYDAVWGVVGADDAGAPHRRKRLWILAHSDSDSLQGLEPKSQQGQLKRSNLLHSGEGGMARWPTWPPEPGLGRVVDGMAHRSHRIKAIGNGQVPRVVAMAWTILSQLKDSNGLDQRNT